MERKYSRQYPECPANSARAVVIQSTELSASIPVSMLSFLVRFSYTGLVMAFFSKGPASPRGSDIRGTCTPVLFLSLLVFHPGICSAQPDSLCPGPGRDVTLVSLVTDDGFRGMKAAGRALSAPVHWDEDDWLLAGGVAGATVASYLADNKVLDLADRNHSSFNDHATDIAVEYGSGAVAIGVPATIYLSGLLLKDRWLRETGLLAGTTMVVASATTTLAKIVVGRARPYGGLGHFRFRPLHGHEEFMSFPSGHTTAAFTLSAVLAARIKNPWASVGLYGAAAGAAVSRVYTRDHWLSDVVFTAAYSTALARSVVHWFENDEQAAQDAHALDIVPSANGIRVAWRW